MYSCKEQNQLFAKDQIVSAKVCIVNGRKRC